jgi:hypothetical protein
MVRAFVIFSERKFSYNWLGNARASLGEFTEAFIGFSIFNREQI